MWTSVRIIDYLHRIERSLSQCRSWCNKLQRTRIAEVLNRKRPLTLAMIRRLHKSLGIPADVLIAADGIHSTARAQLFPGVRARYSGQTSHRALVSFDSNLRLKLWPLDRARACIQQAVALSDIFLPSLEDVTALTGLTEPAAIIDWAHRAGARQVALKLGGDGALVSDGQRQERLSAHRVTLIDATGAGDCFCGNLLTRISTQFAFKIAKRLVSCALAGREIDALVLQGIRRSDTFGRGREGRHKATGGIV